MTSSLPTGDGVQSPIAHRATALTTPPKPCAPIVRSGSLPDRLPAHHKLVASLQQVYLSLYAAEVGVWEWNVTENSVSWSLCVDKIFGLDRKSVV